jgi:hypothetical protein
MPLIAKENSTQSEPAPEGTHVARCVQVIDQGTHYDEKYDKTARRFLLGWELPTEQRAATSDRPAEPYIVWRRYNLSLHEKATLRKDLEAWRGRKFSREELQGFDVANILEKCCFLQIMHNEKDGKIYANIASITALPQAITVPPRHHDVKYFITDEWDETVFHGFSDHLKETILKSKEGQARLMGEVSQVDVTVNEDDEDIPF